MNLVNLQRETSRSVHQGHCVLSLMKQEVRVITALMPMPYLPSSLSSIIGVNSLQKNSNNSCTISIQYYVSLITSTQPNRKQETIHIHPFFLNVFTQNLPSLEMIENCMSRVTTGELTTVDTVSVVYCLTLLCPVRHLCLLFSTLSSPSTTAYCRSMKTCLVLVCEYLS